MLIQRRTQSLEGWTTTPFAGQTAIMLSIEGLGINEIGINEAGKEHPCKEGCLKKLAVA